MGASVQGDLKHTHGAYTLWGIWWEAQTTEMTPPFFLFCERMIGWKDKWIREVKYCTEFYVQTSLVQQKSMFSVASEEIINGRIIHG